MSNFWLVPGARMTKLAGDRLTWFACIAALACGGGTLLFLALFVVAEAFPKLTDFGGILGFLLRDPWSPLTNPPTFGIFHAWVSTLMITFICLLLALPIGFGIGLFATEFAPRFVGPALRVCLDVLAGIPAVVYGFFGYVTLLPFFESYFEMATGESLMVAGIILGMMSLPYIASTSAEAFRMVPRELKEAGLAFGVTRWYLIRRVVLVFAAPGMFAAAALGLARAIGETMAVLMLTGNSTAVPNTLLDRGQPITALIATEIGEAGVGSQTYHSLFASALVLMLIIFSINSVIWLLKKKLIHAGA